MNNLLSVFPVGALSLILLFALCFLLIHTIKLIKLGWQTQRKQPPVKEKAEEKAPAPTQEPVYYIVERKRRTKSSYGEPKRINFK